MQKWGDPAGCSDPSNQAILEANTAGKGLCGPTQPCFKNMPANTKIYMPANTHIYIT